MLWCLYFQYHVSWCRYFFFWLEIYWAFLSLWIGSSINPGKFSAVIFSNIVSAPSPFPVLWLLIRHTLDPLSLSSRPWTSFSFFPFLCLSLQHSNHSFNCTFSVSSSVCSIYPLSLKFQISLLFFKISRTSIWSLVTISCSLHIFLVLPLIL